MTKSILIAVFSGLLLSGCAVKNDTTEIHGLGLTYLSDVKELGNGIYGVAVEASLLSGRESGAMSSSIEDASSFCQNKGLAMEKISDDTDSHFLINGVSYLKFRCK